MRRQQLGQRSTAGYGRRRDAEEGQRSVEISREESVRKMAVMAGRCAAAVAWEDDGVVVWATQRRSRHGLRRRLRCKMERTPSVETETSPETVENDGGVERHR